MLLPQQGGQQVQRGRKPADGGEVAAAAVGGEKMERRAAAEGIGHAHAAAEVEQVGAAAQGQVLAGVDELAGGRIVEAAGASAKAGGLLEQFDAAAVLRRGRGGGESRQAAADHGDARHGTVGSRGEGSVVHEDQCGTSAAAASAQRAAIRSFLVRPRRIAPPKNVFRPAGNLLQQRAIRGHHHAEEPLPGRIQPIQQPCACRDRMLAARPISSSIRRRNASPV